MVSGTGSRFSPIVLWEDDPLETSGPKCSGTKVSPIVLSSDEDDDEQVGDSLTVATVDPPQDDVTQGSTKRYIGGSPSKYCFNGEGVAYNIMLSMGYSPGKGLGRQLKGNITPMPLPLRKRKHGVGFESSPFSSPEPQRAAASVSTSPEPGECSPPNKKPKATTFDFEDEPNTKRTTQSIAMPILPAHPELPSSGTPVPQPIIPHTNAGFEHYVSTLSGFAMAAMPVAMQAAAAADPMTAFHLAQSYFNISPPLISNAPTFVPSHGLPPRPVSGPSMALGNIPRPLPPAKLVSSKPHDQNSVPKSKESNKNKEKQILPQPAKNQRTCIGWIIQLNFPDRGIFRLHRDPKSSQTGWGNFHIPSEECCLVMEDIPNKLRTVEFVRGWSDNFNPRPHFGVVDTRTGKALIEFASHAAAEVAYMSPRLHGAKYAKAQHVRVFWYRRPEEMAKDNSQANRSLPTAIETAQPQLLKKKKKQVHDTQVPVPMDTDTEPRTRMVTRSQTASSDLLSMAFGAQKGKQPDLPNSMHPPRQSVQISPEPDLQSAGDDVIFPASAPPTQIPVLHLPSDFDHTSTRPSTSPSFCAVEQSATAQDVSSEPRTRSKSRSSSRPMNELALATDIALSNPSPSTSTLSRCSSTPPGDTEGEKIQMERLLEKRLRLQLLAKKQLAILESAMQSNTASSSSTPKDPDTVESPRPATCKAASPPPVATPPPPVLPETSPSSFSTTDAASDSVMKDSAPVSQPGITSSLDNLATSFIAETLHSAKEQAILMESTARERQERAMLPSPPITSVLSSVDLATRQQMLARQIAESKLLMRKYQAARTKTEKDEIMQRLKEQNRLMGASKPSKELEQPAQASSTRTTKFCWPQTVDSGVLIVSDDDMDES